MAKELSTRPSDLFGVRDPYARFVFDECVVFVGGYVSNELQNVKGKKEEQRAAARKRLLIRLLDGPEAPGQFADPAQKRT